MCAYPCSDQGAYNKAPCSDPTAWLGAFACVGPPLRKVLSLLGKVIDKHCLLMKIFLSSDDSYIKESVVARSLVTFNRTSWSPSTKTSYRLKYFLYHIALQGVEDVLP